MIIFKYPWGHLHIFVNWKPFVRTEAQISHTHTHNELIGSRDNTRYSLYKILPGIITSILALNKKSLNCN